LQHFAAAYKAALAKAEEDAKSVVAMEEVAEGELPRNGSKKIVGHKDCQTRHAHFSLAVFNDIAHMHMLAI
jgi:hypothetical protein